jgi:predicted membrane-bound spermidine synthase
MSSIQLYLFTYLIAFCSLSYEFILIKLMGLVQGGRISHYNLVVSLFTFFLGIGTLVSSKIEGTKLNLQKVEFLLAAIGLLSPLLLINFQSMNLAIILASSIGFLSGFEIPILMQLKRNEDAKILAYDYFGMFTSSLLIPLFLFKKVGIIPSSIAIALLNLTLAFQISPNYSRKSKVKISLLSWFAFFTMVGFVFHYHHELNGFFSRIYVERAVSP